MYYELLDLIMQKGNATVDIQLWHIWVFFLLISLMVFVKWGRAIAIFSLLASVALGWQESMSAVQETVAATPVMWMGYLLVGAFMLAAISYTFAMEH